MGVLQKAKHTTAFAKVGILGFPGSGKTFTASLLAEGICKLTKTKGVAFFDTETGSDFLIKKLEASGLDVYQTKSRAFTDILEFLKECEAAKMGAVVIDSITHVWRDLCDAYDKKLNRNGRMQFQDWAIIKAEWKRYTDAFVNSSLHIIVCGRAGYEYDYDFNEDGTKDLIKTATRMKVESEFAFEPSLVIEMERTSESKEELKEHMGKADYKAKAAKQAHKPEAGSKWIHRAFVLKDRTDTLNGEVFDYPTFDNFRPHFASLNLGGEHMGLDTSRNSDALFDIKGKTDWKREKEAAAIAFEELTGELDRYIGNRGQDKMARLALLKWAFGTFSETAIADMKAAEIRAGTEQIASVLQASDSKERIQAIVSGEKEKGKEDHEPLPEVKAAVTPAEPSDWDGVEAAIKEGK